MTSKPIFSQTLILLVLLISLSPASHGQAKVQPVFAPTAYPFELQQVRLLDGPFLRAQELDRKYLHELDADRLLHTFRVNAGLPSSAEPYGGWERPDCEVRGHTLGHYLSACALMYAGAQDEALKMKADSIVAELAKCQEALGESGYLSAFPESFIDRVEAAKPVWAPYYTLHKILNGLVDMAVYCDNKQALAVAERMAAWMKQRCDRLSDEQMQKMLSNEQGGMNDVLARLYVLTGNPDHLTLACRFDERAYNDPLIRREDRLKGFHANSFIPTVIGSALQYELTGNETYRTIATYFWDQVTGHRSYATGGTSNHEHWRTDPDVLASELSADTQETCCEYNLLKLTRHLFGWNPDPRYADYYEKTLFNCILSTQDPETGMMMYLVPLESGHFKVFHTPDRSFWCCTGSGMENHAKYGDSIYFHDQEGLYVNLFIASELTWKEKGIALRQETRFPVEEATTLLIQESPAEAWPLRIRIPSWATQGVKVKVNGEALDIQTTPSSYLTLNRPWKSGDRVEVELPMSLYLHPMPDDKNLTAVLYGPLVLAAELGTEKLTRDMQYVKNQRDQVDAPRIPIPRLVVDNQDPNQWLKPVADKPLTFQTYNVGLSHDLTFIPFHQLFHQRYAVYWPLHSQAEWETIDHRQAMEQARQSSVESRIVDQVSIGNPASEKEHHLQSSKSQHGSLQGKAWRHASEDGWFSFDLKVLPDQPMSLQCTYWGDDAGRVFEIRVEDRQLFRETLDHNAPGRFFSRTYEIPVEWTQGQDKATVTFRSLDGKIAGGVFGCRMLKDRDE